MSSYAGMAAMAEKLVDKYGRHGFSLMRRPTGSTEGGKPWKPTGSMAPETLASGLICVVLTAQAVRQTMKGAEAFLHPEATHVAFASAASMAGEQPLVGDVIAEGSVHRSVVQVDELKPGDVAILYTIQLKG